MFCKLKKPILKVFLLSFALFLTTPGFAQENFRLGIVNERPDRADHALNQYLPLNNYLKQKLAEKNIKVAPLTVANSVEELTSLISNGKIDAILEGVMPTLILRKQTQQLYPEMLIWRKGQRQYHSVFFTHKQSEHTSLEKLENQLIVFESPRSTSAFFIPKITLESMGYQLVEFGKTFQQTKNIPYVFSGSESNQAYWVHSGKAKIGAFNNGDWERIPAIIKKDLKIIGQTKPVLRWLLSYTSSGSSQTKDAVNQVLSKAHLDKQGQTALKAAANIKKIEPLSKQDLENLQYWDNLLHK